MRNEFTAAAGQGATREEWLENLRGAIALILGHWGEESLRCLAPEASQEIVVTG